MKIDVNEALNQLAKAFNVAVDELYPILYKQGIINGIFSFTWAGLFMVLIIAFALSLKYIIKKQNEQGSGYEWDWDEPRQVTVLILGIVATVIGIAVIPITLHSGATAIFNTDYYIIKDILSELK